MTELNKKFEKKQIIAADINNNKWNIRKGTHLFAGLKNSEHQIMKKDELAVE